MPKAKTAGDFLQFFMAISEKREARDPLRRQQLSLFSLPRKCVHRMMLSLYILLNSFFITMISKLMNFTNIRLSEILDYRLFKIAVPTWPDQ